MKWTKLSIETKTACEDMISAMLMRCGIEAIEIEDNLIPAQSIEKEGGFFEELMPDMDEDDKARVIFYLEGEEISEDNRKLISKVEEELSLLKESTDIGSGKISVSVSDENDWRDKWKEYFHSVYIDDILIKPTWEESNEDAEYVIEIDPGISFGTGAHESTRLCIEALRKENLQGTKVLDIGCGSGILSIAALKLGAASAVGTDIDPDCMEAVKSNFAINGLDEACGQFYVGNLADDTQLQEKIGKGAYDIVLANILADIIISMKDQIYDALKPGGILIASGIIDFKEDDLKSALTGCGFDIAEINHMGEWVEITALKPQQ